MKIGICTGGGDCPGLNATIRAVVKYALLNRNVEVIGIKDSINGLRTRPLEAYPLHQDDVSAILSKGGTILGTQNRGNPFDGADGREKMRLTLEGISALKLDVVIMVGGEGTQGIAAQLMSKGVKVIGIPKTIDNDLPGTEQTIGFASCIDLVAESVMRLQSTAESHDRIMVLEVMGRDSGYIALHGGLAGGAHVILIPEIPFNLDAVQKRINGRKKFGRRYSVVVVSEGAAEAGSNALYANTGTGSKVLGGIGQHVAQKLYQLTGMDARVTTLGHLQRGGSPNTHDKILATRFGVHAIDLALAGKFNRLVSLRGDHVVDISYDEIRSWERRKIPENDGILRAAEAIGICLGR